MTTDTLEPSRRLDCRPRWPAFIRFRGDHELHFIASQSAWEQDAALSQVKFHPQDVLVDADGNLFHLQPGPAGLPGFKAGAGSLSLQDVLQLVRQHAAQDGACCVAKLSAGSIAEAIALLE